MNPRYPFIVVALLLLLCPTPTHRAEALVGDPAEDYVRNRVEAYYTLRHRCFSTEPVSMFVQVEPEPATAQADPSPRIVVRTSQPQVVRRESRAVTRATKARVVSASGPAVARSSRGEAVPQPVKKATSPTVVSGSESVATQTTEARPRVRQAEAVSEVKPREARAAEAVEKARPSVQSREARADVVRTTARAVIGETPRGTALLLDKAGMKPVLPRQGEFTFRIRYKNRSAEALGGVTIVDHLPPSVRFVRAGGKGFRVDVGKAPEETTVWFHREAVLPPGAAGEVFVVVRHAPRL